MESTVFHYSDRSLGFVNYTHYMKWGLCGIYSLCINGISAWRESIFGKNNLSLSWDFWLGRCCSFKTFLCSCMLTYFPAFLMFADLNVFVFVFKNLLRDCHFFIAFVWGYCYEYVLLLSECFHEDIHNAKWLELAIFHGVWLF